MEKLKSFWEVFTSVVTCVSFGTASYISIFFPNTDLGTNIIWQILVVSFLCSIWSILYANRELGKKQLMIAYVVHYLLVNVIVLGCGLWFEWFDSDNLLQIIGMLIVIAGVYLTVCFVTWKREAREAKLMNERLWAYQEEREGKKNHSI